MKIRAEFLISAAVVLAGCGEVTREPESAAATTPLAVKVAAASNEEWPSYYQTTGTVRARSSTVVAAKWMGYVRDLKVQIGDRVRAGQLLVALDARDLDAAANRASAARAQVVSAMPEADGAVASAKAHLDLVETTHRRMRELYEKKSISDQEFDESTAKLKAAQADFAMAKARRAQLDDKLGQADQEVRAAQVARSYAEIQAPVAGMVTAKSVESGTLAVPGTPLLTIESGGYRLEASIEESKLSSLRTGTAATIKLDGMDRAIEGRVTEIVPAVDSASRSFLAKIDLPALAGLRSGLFGTAKFRFASRSVLTIPIAALIERGQLQSVFVADAGTARTRLVTTGVRSNDRAEILSGLTAGENVIVPIPAKLSDGSKVEVRP